VLAWDLLTQDRRTVGSYDSDEAFPTDVDVTTSVTGRSSAGDEAGDTVAVVRPREAGAVSSTVRLIDPGGRTRWTLGEADLGGWPVTAEFSATGTELLVDTVSDYGGAQPVAQLVVVDSVGGSSRPLGPASPFDPAAYYDPWVKGVAEDGGTAMVARPAQGEGQTVGTLDVESEEITWLDPGGRDIVGSSWVSVEGGVVELAEDGAVYWCPDGSTVYTRRLSSHVSRATAAATDAGGRVLVTGGTDRRVVVHELQDGGWVLREVLDGHTGSVREIAVSPDGLRAFSTGEDRTVIEWDLSDTALTTSPDGRWLGIGDFSGRVTVADAQTYEVTHELTAAGPVAALAFSGDGTRLAAVGGSKALDLWDTTTGQDVLNEPPRFGGAGTSVAWLADDRTVVHGGDDGRAVLFDTRLQRVRGVPLPVLRDGGDGVVHVAPPRADSNDLTLLPGPRTGRAVREGMVYPLDVSAWLGHACGVAARDLTDTEWDAYLPDRPPERTCSTLERSSTT